MPGMDGRGPGGAGPRSGRGRGYCYPLAQPGRKGSGPGMGLGAMAGRGPGLGPGIVSGLGIGRGLGLGRGIGMGLARGMGRLMGYGLRCRLGNMGARYRQEMLRQYRRSLQEELKAVEEKLNQPEEDE